MCFYILYLTETPGPDLTAIGCWSATELFLKHQTSQKTETLRMEMWPVIPALSIYQSL